LPRVECVIPELVLLNPKRNVLGEANVTPSFGILENVDAINHRNRKKLVAGAGFEPAIPPPRRDYEHGDRSTPVR
jgi:hypothetical protein